MTVGSWAQHAPEQAPGLEYALTDCPKTARSEETKTSGLNMAEDGWEGNGIILRPDEIRRCVYLALYRK